MNFRQRRKRTLELSLTPMIDVVFLLLIFFMVTTTFNRETALKIKLPEANGSETTEQKNIVLSINSKGVYAIDKKPLLNQSIETLKRALRQASGNAKKLPLVIHADAKTPHQAVISALEAAGDIGFSQISFAAIQPTQRE